MKKNNEIVNRSMIALGYQTKRELAKTLNISPSNLNNRINSGTIRESLIDLAIQNNLNVDWLLTGEGCMTTGTGNGKQPTNNTKGGSETELDDWHMRQLLEQITKRLDDLSLRLNDQTRHIEDATKVITRYRDELETIQKNQADLKTSDTNINQAIDAINATLVSIKGRMLDASRSGRVEDLGGETVNG